MPHPVLLTKAQRTKLAKEAKELGVRYVIEIGEIKLHIIPDELADRPERPEREDNRKPIVL